MATLAFVFFVVNSNLFAQKTTETMLKVTKVDDVTIKEILKPNGKPLLVNFWATWCVPCREEFPELVKIDEEYKGKIDFITISLDDPAEINRDVPKFLNEMKATMPAYLLRTNDESAVIGAISKDWSGGLPFTVLYDEKGGIVYTRQGKIKTPDVREILNNLILGSEKADFYLKGRKDAENDIANGKVILKNTYCKSQTVYKSVFFKKNQHLNWGRREPEPIPQPNEPTFELDCKETVDHKDYYYMNGYNSVSRLQIMKIMEINYFPRDYHNLNNFPAKIDSLILTKNKRK